MLSDDFLMELRSRNSIEQVISPYVQLRRRGKNLVGLCPFHNEKTPSFTVYPENQSFYCFGCGAGGEIISFVRRINNIDFIEAVRTLADNCGMSMPEEGYDDSLLKKRRRMYEINRKAANFFYEYMMSPQGKKGLDYFLSRGLSPSIIKRFGLGYAPDAWDGLLKYMKDEGYSQEELYEANLVNRSEKDGRVRYYDSFRNRAMVPIIDVRGNVVAFGGRVLDDSKPKYINTSDTLVYKKSYGVFGLNFAKNRSDRSIIVVEGYMDVIALHQAGFTNAIACLGTALTTEMAQLINRYADEVILCYDSDEAGQKAAKRAMEIFGSIGELKLRVVQMSGGKDPDEIIRNHGAERFRSLLDGAANDVEYKILSERAKYDLRTTDGKLEFLKAVAQLLADTGSRITCDLYASRLSEELSVGKDAILAQIEDNRKRRNYGRRKAQWHEAQKMQDMTAAPIGDRKGHSIRAVNAEETLIASLMRNPDFLKKVEEKISPSDFVTEFNKRVFEVIIWRIRQDRVIDLTVLCEYFSPEEMDRVNKIFRKAETIGNTLKECRDCIDVIKQEKAKEATSSRKVSDLPDDEFLKLFGKK